MPNYMFPAQAEEIEGLRTPYEWVRDLLYGNEVKRIADAERLVPARRDITDEEVKELLWRKAIHKLKKEENITYQKAKEKVFDKFGKHCGWVESGKPYLCFPYARKLNKNNYPRFFTNNTQKDNQFWLYMYYRMENYNNNFALGGRIYFRIHGIGWRNKNFRSSKDKEDRYNCSNVHYAEDYPNMKTTIRFICDKFEEIRLTNDNLVRIEKFRHPMGKSLPHLMRNQFVGLPPVECTEEFKIIRHYP